MLHQTTLGDPNLPPPLLAELIAGARRSLDRDPQLARSYLDRIITLLDAPAKSEDAMLPAAPTDAAERSMKGGLTPWQLTRVQRYVEERLEGTVFVETLAEVAKLSPGHFCRAFKASIGETPHAFLVRQRIRRAQALMLETGDTLSQIAYACGLTDQAHLTRLFRRLVGDTPMAWRRRHQRTV